MCADYGLHRAYSRYRTRGVDRPSDARSPPAMPPAATAGGAVRNAGARSPTRSPPATATAASLGKRKATATAVGGNEGRGVPRQEAVFQRLSSATEAASAALLRNRDGSSSSGSGAAFIGLLREGDMVEVNIQCADAQSYWSSHKLVRAPPHPPVPAAPPRVAQRCPLHTHLPCDRLGC